MSDQQGKTPDKLYRTVVFLGVQLALVATGIGIAHAKLQKAHSRQTLPSLRLNPSVIGPLYDDREVVSDDQLRAVLSKLRPRLRGANPKIYDVTHALRCWGAEATFRDPDCLSGPEIRQVLVNCHKFAEFWGKGTKPLVFQDAGGVDVRVKEGLATTAHVDQLLAGLAEVGTPLDFPVRTPTGKSRVRSMLERSLLTFSLNQHECEWSALAYALYLPPVDAWVSSEGQSVTFDAIAARLMRGELSRGACYGNHRLHGLVMFLRVDEEHAILSPTCRARVVEHLERATATLTQSQHVDGYWDKNWSKGRPTLWSSDEQEAEELDPLGDRLQVTGHVLEWLALSPEEVLPPRNVLITAGQWLAQAVIDLDEQERQDGYPFLTHAGRALALWRGRFPADFLSSTGFEEL